MMRSVTGDELDALLKRHEAFWRREPGSLLLHVRREEAEPGSLHAPLSGVTVPLPDGSDLAAQHTPITPDQLDPSLILDIDEFPRRTGRIEGPGPHAVDALLVTRAPLGKMVWVESILGCPVIPRLDTGSIYSAPFLEDIGDLSSLPKPEESPWLDVLLRYTRLLAQASNGEYQVVQCLMRGTIDLVSAVMGHSEMCYALYDNPKAVRELTEHCTRTFIMVAKRQEELWPQLKGGYTHAFAVWAPGTVVRTQCDVTSSVSAQMYEEFFIPYENEICSHFDYSAVHLHSGYLHTVDVFLKDKYPTAVEVALDTGSTPHTVHSLIPTFQRILEEKPLFIHGRMTGRELDECLERLPHRGLYISTLSPINE
ncbi:MAG: hypothetical protein FJ313_00500 [Gemmatimonadetes bacterium]|nr:hypothetical protein [Gemmatimonadota bacterium]